jgi:vacuolar protein sorting-associated protein VTA1
MKDTSLTFYNLFKEFREKEPIMGYFCGLYAAKLAIEHKNNEFIKALLSDLESMKQSIASHPALTNDSKSFAYVLQFASRIFLSADDEDRSGLATAATAQAFITASNLFTVLGLFKDKLPTELSDRINYGKIKAVEIVKKLKEVGDTTPKAKSKSPDTTLSNSKPISCPPPRIEKSPSEPSPRSPPVGGNTPIPSVPVSPDQSSAAALPSFSGTFNPLSPNTATPIIDASVLNRAEKYARQAVSALQFEDVSTAKQQLERALSELNNMK